MIVNSTLYITGWGKHIGTKDSQISDVLRQTMITVKNRFDCVTVSDNQFCAGKIKK